MMDYAKILNRPHFETPVGDITLEYRNDSNGYYGGYVVEL